jgi:DNA polymerase-3 subunit beta
MIERVGFSITTEDPRYSLHGALLLVQAGTLTLVATDGYRLAYASRKGVAGKSADIRVIVPRKALGEVGKLAAEVPADDAVTFGKSGNHVFFTVGEHTLTTTVPEGNFPNYEEVMPKRCETELVLPTADLTDAVKRVSLLASDRFGRAVRFMLSNGRLELASETEMGEANEVLTVDYKGEDKTIGFNARYVLDFLGVVGTPAVRLDLDPVRESESDADRKTKKAGDKPGQFRPDPAGELDYRYIVMPRDL